MWARPMTRRRRQVPFHARRTPSAFRPPGSLRRRRHDRLRARGSQVDGGSGRALDLSTGALAKVDAARGQTDPACQRRKSFVVAKAVEAGVDVEGEQLEAAVGAGLVEPCVPELEIAEGEV